MMKQLAAATITGVLAIGMVTGSADAKSKPVVDKALRSACADVGVYYRDGVGPDDGRVLALTSRSFKRTKNTQAHKFAKRFLASGAKLDAAVLDAYAWCNHQGGLAHGSY